MIWQKQYGEDLNPTIWMMLLLLMLKDFLLVGIITLLLRLLIQKRLLQAPRGWLALLLHLLLQEMLFLTHSLGMMVSLVLLVLFRQLLQELEEWQEDLQELADSSISIMLMRLRSMPIILDSPRSNM